MTLGESQAEINAQLRAGTSRKTRGLCMSINDADGTVVVNIGGGEQTMPMLTRPSIGWDVWVFYHGAEPICMGPVYRAPGGAVVAAPSAGQVQLRGDDNVVRTLPYATALDLEVGDRVAVYWPAELVIAEPAADATVVDPLPPQGGGAVERESIFHPTDSGSYGSAWFTSEVYCSDNNIGCYFYEGIADTIPDGAEIISIQIYVDSLLNSGGAPTLGLHNLAAKTGAPVVSGSHATVGGTGWKGMPNSYGDSPNTGAARGIGTNHGGYHRWAPARPDNNSGTLVIRWRG